MKSGLELITEENRYMEVKEFLPIHNKIRKFEIECPNTICYFEFRREGQNSDFMKMRFSSSSCESQNEYQTLKLNELLITENWEREEFFQIIEKIKEIVEE